MSDTIELLDAIGRNAALRYAPAGELARTLDHADASAALRAAVMSGDSSRLSEEFGHKTMRVPQVTQAPGHEDDEPDQDDDEVPPTPEPSSRR